MKDEGGSFFIRQSSMFFIGQANDGQIKPAFVVTVKCYWNAEQRFDVSTTC